LCVRLVEVLIYWLEFVLGTTLSMSEIRDIIDSYDSVIVRAYVTVRFYILRQRFLAEIGQYLPATGLIVDIGCGFGLFALFFALSEKGRVVHGFDLNDERIEMARAAASKLGANNVQFQHGDARHLPPAQKFDAAYMLDIVHYIPPESVPTLINWVRQHLSPDGVFLIKDVADRPWYKRLFTWVLDKLMDYRTPVHYWAPDQLMAQLRASGFSVHHHSMVDFLPYPHVLYICRPTAGSTGSLRGGT